MKLISKSDPVLHLFFLVFSYWYFESNQVSAEFFAFFGLSGKFASIFGPLIYGILITITGSVQSGVLSVLFFFLAGMAVLWTVNEKKGMEEKQSPVF